MIEFDYDKIMRPKAVVHCDEEWKANNLLKWADSIGLKWCSNDTYLQFTGWRRYKKNTSYDFYRGEYADCDFFIKINYTIYEYEDVIMNKIEDGWYYIKLNQPKEIEEFLPPTRCIYVNNNKAMIHKSLSFNTLFDVTENMIESPAYVIGKEYEFSDDRKEWIKKEFGGYVFEKHNCYNYTTPGYFYYKYIREIKKPDIEITVKINGNEVRLSEISEETLLKIRQNS